MNERGFQAHDIRPQLPVKKGRSTAPFQVTSAAVPRPYWIALSVICAVQAPDGSFEMIFWSSSALAVRS